MQDMLDEIAREDGVSRVDVLRRIIRPAGHTQAERQYANARLFQCYLIRSALETVRAALGMLSAACLRLDDELERQRWK